MILGEFLAFRHSRNVLLIDMDAQANLSYCMIPGPHIERQGAEGRTTYHLLRAGFEGGDLDIRDYITQPPLVVSNISRNGMSDLSTNIHMVVSTPDVAQLDSDLLDMWAEGRPMPRQVRSTLLRAIEPVADMYDYILIDCPPGLSVFSSAALVGSDYYISPVIPEPLSLQGVGLIQERQRQLRQSENAKAKFRGVMLNIVKHYRNTHSRWLKRSIRLTGIGICHSNTGYRTTNSCGALESTTRIWRGNGRPAWSVSLPTSMISTVSLIGWRTRVMVPWADDKRKGCGTGYGDRISNLVEEFMERCPPGRH